MRRPLWRTQPPSTSFFPHPTTTTTGGCPACRRCHPCRTCPRRVLVSTRAPSERMSSELSPILYVSLPSLPLSWWFLFIFSSTHRYIYIMCFFQFPCLMKYHRVLVRSDFSTASVQKVGDNSPCVPTERQGDKRWLLFSPCLKYLSMSSFSRTRTEKFACTCIRTDEDS